MVKSQIDKQRSLEECGDNRKKFALCEWQKKKKLCAKMATAEVIMCIKIKFMKWDIIIQYVSKLKQSIWPINEYDPYLIHSIQIHTTNMCIIWLYQSSNIMK